MLGLGGAAVVVVVLRKERSSVVEVVEDVVEVDGAARRLVGHLSGRYGRHPGTVGETVDAASETAEAMRIATRIRIRTAT